MDRINNSDKQAINIGSDSPKSDPGTDEFGYAPFAALIARAVIETPSPEGLVMAVHGHWGVGKSTLLNFVKHYLNLGHEAKPIIIDFNPWWFDDRDHLASQFLAQFKSSLGMETKLIRDVGDLLADYSEYIGKAIAYSTGIPWLDKSAIFLRALKRKNKLVPELKTEISHKLKQNRQRFLIVIDDIDRLTPSEIGEVFKVVKALADFPNVIYLLSFDRNVVARALSTCHGLDGEAYLEKIVQVPLVLPTVPKERLHQKLFSELNKLIDEADLELFDQTYWSNVFFEGIAPFITKPRDIIRYVNALAITFQSLRNEVNVVDFLALECLRVNLPRLYNTIRENPKRFAGHSNQGLKSTERTTELAFHEKWVHDLDETVRSGVQAMLELIFPRLSNTGQGPGILSEWRRLRRAASPDIFSYYFAFTINNDQISRQEIISFVEGLTNQEQTQRTLLNAINEKRHDGSSKAKGYLSFLLDFSDEINGEMAANLLFVISRIADKLIIKADEKGGTFATQSISRIHQVVQHALSRVEDNKRDKLLLEAFTEGESRSFLSWFVFVLLRSYHATSAVHGPATVLSTIKSETIESLKKIALARIREAATNNTLINDPELSFVIARWHDWSNPEEAKQWVDQLIDDKLNFVNFLTALLGEIHSSSYGDKVTKIQPTMDLHFLSKLIELDKIAGLLKNIDPSIQLSENNLLAINTFNQKYQEILDGKNPNSPFSII